VRGCGAPLCAAAAISTASESCRPKPARLVGPPAALAGRHLARGKQELGLAGSCCRSFGDGDEVGNTVNEAMHVLQHSAAGVQLIGEAVQVDTPMAAA
jgi:hypothetical protein